MRIVRSAISNPYAVAVAAMMILILGAVCLTKLPKDMLPVFKTPAVQILTFYPGMPAEIVEKDITTRLERWTGQSNGIARQESKSMVGVSIVKDFFRPDIDPNTAMSQVTSFAMSDLYYLPPGTIPPMVMPFDPTAAVPLALLTVEHPEMNETQLYDVAYFNLRNMLQGISGVIAPAVYGGTLRRIFAYVDPRKLTERNLSPMDVAESLRNSNVMIPTGNAKFGGKDYQIVTNAMVEHVADMNDFLIRGELGVPVYVRDVAKVEDTHQIQTNVARVNGKRQVYIPVYRQPGANTIEVVEGIKSALKGILERLPKGMKLNITADQSVFVRNAIRNLAAEVVLGGLLAVVMVLLFLGSWRASLSVILALPLSILAAFIGLLATGQAINAMTLGGLALAVGVLIDNSIVVLENITRHMESGSSRAEAALNAASEVSLPVLAATTTMVIVFLPVTFLTGIGKFLFTPLALSVVFAILTSYVLAMTLVPCFCALFLKSEKSSESTWFNKTVGLYEAALRFCLSNKTPSLVAALLALAASLSLYPKLGKELFPRSDVGHLNVQVRLPTGTNVNETEKAIAEIEKRLPEAIESAAIRTVISNIGVLNDWPAAYTPNSGPQDAFLEIELSEKRQHSSFEYADKLRKFMAENFPGVEVAVETGGLLTAALNEGLPAPINIQVQGNDLRTSTGLAQEIVKRAKAVPGTVDVRIQERLDQPQVYVRLDRKKITALGLTVQEVVKNVVTAFNSSVNFAPAFWIDEKSGNHYFLGAQYPEELIENLETLKNVPITGRNQNRVVRLKEIATFEERQAPSEVRHVNISRTLNVFVNVSGRDIGSVADQIEAGIRDIRVPEGFAVRMRGEVSAMRESFKNLRFGLILAVILVYLVLVAQFRSFLDPLLILCSVPLGLMGVLLILWLTGTRVNIQSFIGVIFMVGIAVANGILLIDFANRLWSQGTPADEAVIRAGVLRLRPILMTALSAMLGLLPMAVGIGHGAEANVPLARAVLGGLSVSTFLTLLVVPVLYALFKGRQTYRPMGEEPAEKPSAASIRTDGTRIAALVLALFIGASVGVAAAETPRILTLEEATATALGRHPDIVAAKARIEGARSGVVLARSSFWPRVTASAMQSRGLGGSSSAIGITGLVNSPYRKDPAVGVDAAWNVYDFGRTSHRSRAAERQLEGLQEDLRRTEDSIRLGVSESFYQCAEYESLGGLMGGRLKDQREIVQEVEGYVRSGLKSPVEQDLARSTLSGIRARQAEVSTQEQVSSTKLVESMGLDDFEPFICATSTVSVPPLPALGSFLARAMEARPEVAAAKSKLERAKANLIAANREDWPILSAVGSAGALSKTSLVPKQEWSAAIGIRLPLFEGFRISAAQQAAAAEIQLAEAELARLKISVSREIKNAYALTEGSRERVGYLQEQLGHADRAYRLARKRYLEKTGPLSDLRDAQTAYFQVSEKEMGGRYEFYRTARKLKILTGEGS